MKYNTNDILNSLTGIERAEAPGHFYAALRAKMERQQKEASRPRQLRLRPVFVSALLFIFLTINIFVLSSTTGNNKIRSQNETTGIRAFSEAYNLNAQSFVQ